MKQVHSITFLFMILLLIGCNENLTDLNEEIKKPDFMNMDNQKQVDYVKKQLVTLGRATVALSNDLDFKTQLYSEVEKTFDGETNVLFKTLDGNGVNTGRSYESKIERSLTEVVGGESMAKSAMSAFEGIAGKNYYPQIFIPFYDELKQSGKIGKEKPVLVIGVADMPLYSGYYLTGKNELMDVGFQVDEEYAKQNEVWVISINERVDNNGNLQDGYKKLNTLGKTKGVSYPNARLNTMKITSYKESWAYGASEINIKRWLSFYRWDQYSSAQHAKGLTSEDTPEDGDGKHIRDFSRKEVKNSSSITIDWVYVPDWPNQTGIIDGSLYHTDYLYYVIFEYDPWPTGLNSFGLLDAAGNAGFNVCYRSADGYYSQGYIQESWANSKIINEGGLYTNSQY